ncbi:MAG TPA: hypothetical protein VJM34_17565 [Novosphingobium sp.]|nr:hypothetical protein [Novosphingobium sp.]
MPRQFVLTAMLLATTAALAGCGGGGEINSASSLAGPAVPAATPQTTQTTQTAQNTRTPLPPTPATTSGTYQAIATHRSFTLTPAPVTTPDGRTIYATQFVEPDQVAPAGSVTIAVDANTRTYTLTAAVGPYGFPSDKMTMPANSDLGYTRNGPLTSGTTPDFFSPIAQKARGDLLTNTVPAGTTSDGAPRVITTWLRLFNVGQLDGGPRYLSAAQWGQFYQENASGVPAPENYKVTKETAGTLVFGQRTASSDIPATGTARYGLRSFFTNEGCNSDVTDCTGFSESKFLNVDFGQAKLSAVYERSAIQDLFETDDEGYPILNEDESYNTIGKATLALRTSGTTNLIGADFAIPLSGTGSVHIERTDSTPVADITRAVAGVITGAFFGPQAAEVGGIWSLPLIGSDGTVSSYFDAFVGQRAAP